MLEHFFSLLKLVLRNENQKYLKMFWRWLKPLFSEEYNILV